MLGGDTVDVKCFLLKLWFVQNVGGCLLKYVHCLEASVIVTENWGFFICSFSGTFNKQV